MDQNQDQSSRDVYKNLDLLPELDETDSVEVAVSTEPAAPAIRVPPRHAGLVQPYLLDPALAVAGFGAEPGPTVPDAAERCAPGDSLAAIVSDFEFIEDLWIKAGVNRTRQDLMIEEALERIRVNLTALRNQFPAPDRGQDA